MSPCLEIGPLEILPSEDEVLQVGPDTSRVVPLEKGKFWPWDCTETTWCEEIRECCERDGRGWSCALWSQGALKISSKPPAAGESFSHDPQEEPTLRTHLLVSDFSPAEQWGRTSCRYFRASLGNSEVANIGHPLYATCYSRHVLSIKAL